MTREEAIEYLVPINEEFKKLGFNRQLTTAIDVLTSNHWHKASEELPDEDGIYLVLCGKSLYTTVIEYTASPRYWHIIGYQSDVRYWMPIPKLPKED